MSELFSTTEALNKLLLLVQKDIYGENTWPYPLNLISGDDHISTMYYMINGTVVGDPIGNYIENGKVHIACINLRDVSNKDIDAVFTFEGGTRTLEIQRGTYEKLLLSQLVWYMYRNTTPATSWIIDHNLGKVGVSVDLYSIDNQIVTGVSITINELTNNTIELVFTQPMCGYVIIK